jgi:hypothetical protein
LKHLYLVIFVAFLPLLIFAQQFDRSIVWGGMQADNASRILMDNNGDFICAGTYSGNSDFPLGILTGYGFQDVFITKTASDGTPIWQMGIGGSSTDQMSSIAIDAANNIWIAGRFQSSIDLDPGPESTILNANPSAALDGFIAKYSGTDGSLIQFFNLSAGGVIDIRSIQINDDNEIFLAGQFAQTVDFDFGPASHEVTSNLNSGDGFVAKYNSNMQLQWVNPIGSMTPAIDYFSDIKLSPDGSLYVTGLLGGMSDVDPGAGQTILNAAIDAVLIRYSQSDGSLSWGFILGGNSVDVGTSLMITDDMDVVLVGSLNSSSMDVDPSPASFILSKSGSLASPFIAKYSSSAELLDAIILGGSLTTSASINKVMPGFGNSILVLGSFEGTLDIDPGLNSDEILISEDGSNDAFIIQYTHSWELERFLHITGPGDEILNDAVFSGIYVYGAAQFNDYCRPNAEDTTTVELKSSGFDAAIFVWNMNPEVLSLSDSQEKDLTVYPNPASSVINISENIVPQSIQAIDMQGRVHVLNNQNSTCDISGLSQGLYVIELTATDGQIHRAKVLKY